MIILGVDPGLNATGYGLIEADGRQLRLIVAGDIRPPRSRALPERLEVLHHELAVIIAAHTPDVAVLEKIYTHHAHITTAARMGHARGVACLAAEQHGVRVVEFQTPTYERFIISFAQRVLI